MFSKGHFAFQFWFRSHLKQARCLALLPLLSLRPRNLLINLPQGSLLVALVLLVREGCYSGGPPSSVTLALIPYVPNAETAFCLLTDIYRAFSQPR